ALASPADPIAMLAARGALVRPSSAKSTIASDAGSHLRSQSAGVELGDVGGTGVVNDQISAFAVVGEGLRAPHSSPGILRIYRAADGLLARDGSHLEVVESRAVGVAQLARQGCLGFGDQRLFGGGRLFRLDRLRRGIGFRPLGGRGNRLRFERVVTAQ